MLPLNKHIQNRSYTEPFSKLLLLSSLGKQKYLFWYWPSGINGTSVQVFASFGLSKIHCPLSVNQCSWSYAMPIPGHVTANCWGSSSNLLLLHLYPTLTSCTLLDRENSSDPEGNWELFTRKKSVGKKNEEKSSHRSSHMISQTFFSSKISEGTEPNSFRAMSVSCLVSRILAIPRSQGREEKRKRISYKR